MLPVYERFDLLIEELIFTPGIFAAMRSGSPAKRAHLIAR